MMRRCLLIVAMAALTAIAPAHAETLGFVLIQWHNAGQFTPDGIVECPKGFNADNAPFQESKGTVSNGFNLDGSKDGRSASTCPHAKFSAPDGEKGIDNQLYRTQACIRSARPDDPADALTNSEIVTNGVNRWLVEVTGVDDVVNDDHVDVTLAHGLDKLPLDVNGKFIPGSTQRIDEASPAYVFHTTGRIVKGTLITEPVEGLEIGQRAFVSARLKLDLSPDGARGVIGGYHDIERFYRASTKTSGAAPQFYTALQRNADGVKNAKTGKCSAISAAYDLEFVRAFILHTSSAVVAESPTPSVSPVIAAKPEPKSANAPAPVRLITEAQYLNTLRAIFGDGLTYPVKFARVHRVGGLIAVGTGAARITSGLLDQFDTAARTVAAQVVSPANRSFLIPCRPQSETASDDVCAQQFLKHVGPLLFRRPLTSGELAAYGSIAHESADKFHDFYDGLGVTLASLLVAPDFLHVLQPLDGANHLTAYAKASRLSLLLWNAYPDEELLTAAQTGALNTPTGLTTQVERMIASPRLEAGVRSFFEDMLMFENYETLTKDKAIYPTFTGQVRDDAREQTLRTLVAHVVHDNADYRDVFTSRKTFLTSDLGTLYGVKVGRTDGWTPYEFAAGNPRAGLLTQASFLALYAQPGRSSPTRRGKAIREIFLCQAVPNAPPNVDFSKLEDLGKVFRTSRDRLDAHRSNPVCAGCHKITDPIGLALENFDGAGIYRAVETRTPIDASGQLDDASFSDVDGLGQAMHDNPKTTSCLTQRLTSYALGRTLKSGDDVWLSYINTQFAANGYRVKDLLRTIALSNAFYQGKKQSP